MIRKTFPALLALICLPIVVTATEIGYDDVFFEKSNNGTYITPPLSLLMVVHYTPSLGEPSQRAVMSYGATFILYHLPAIFKFRSMLLLVVESTLLERHPVAHPYSQYLRLGIQLGYLGYQRQARSRHNISTIVHSAREAIVSANMAILSFFASIPV